ncbi:MAG TPA: immunoglobulin domain-containing protein [Clostridia bacterium]|nr:immunoglobulin domain-containing protein [Clostridia bacterium]
MQIRPLLIAAMLAGAGTAQAAFNPVPITPGSYTVDVVVEKTAPPPLGIFTTATMDGGNGGTNNNSSTFFEQGYCSVFPTLGLPVAGTVFNSAALPDHQFKMPASYATANALLISSRVPPGALVLTTPATYVSLSILYAAAGGDTTVAYTIQYQSGTPETGSFNAVDWWNGTKPADWGAYGRINMDNGTFNGLNDITRNKLFSYDIPVDASRPVARIEFSTTSGNRVAIFALSGSATGVGFTPVDFTGFNKDMVVEATATPAAFVGGVNVIMDGSTTNLTGNTFFEQGFDPINKTVGLPVANSTFTTGNKTFRMAPSYTDNNCVYIANLEGYTTASITLGGATALTSLSFLSSAGNGPVSINYVLYFADGNTQSGKFDSLDWFNGATPAFMAKGRVHVTDCTINNRNESNCKVWASDVGVNFPSPITRIDFTYGSGGRAAIFAVSGQTTAGGSFSPLTVNGFNADIVVEASRKLWTAGLFTATTATMDEGTNNIAYTWYERGWYTNFPSTGLPQAGSTFTSLSNPDRSYTMAATYAGPNAVLINTNNKVANITPVTPAAFTSFSLLTAGASIGGNNTMTNVCILQHADGTAETNLFYGYDWFNGTLGAAYMADGRTDTRFRNVANLLSGYPRLFESQFVLANPASPVTNIQVQYKSAGGVNWATYVLAVSGSADPVAPFFTLPTPSLTVMEGSNFVMNVDVLGSQPITCQWQKSTDNVTWSDLPEGGAVSGVTTPVLAFNNVGWTNKGYYRVVAHNSIGYTTNTVGRLTVIAAAPDVTSPTDAIDIVAGSTPNGEPVRNGINNNLAAKWLNFDADGVAPFVGPVGLVVSPNVGKTTLYALRLYTANDDDRRDPVDYLLEGSNDGVNFTVISQGPLALPTERNNSGAVEFSPWTSRNQELQFTNTVAYSTYRLSFNNVRNNTDSTCMQIGEIEFIGTVLPTPPVFTRQPVPSAKVFVGASPSFSVEVKGYPTNFTFQWFVGGTPIAGATRSSYTLAGAQTSDSGKSFTCRVENSAGFNVSTPAVLNVVPAATGTYATAIMADNPAAWFRLNEGPDDTQGNNSLTAADSWGAHPGVYSNVTLSVSGQSTVDADLGTLFGYINTSANVPSDSFVGGITGLDFSAPTNVSATFSVEAWIKATEVLYDAGIVSKGAGGGGEQFTLDTGGTAAGAHGIRFFVRNAAGTVISANTGTNLLDAAWHHVVGICDQVNSNVSLYVDGRLSSRVTMAPGSGLQFSPEPVSIGARRGGATTGYNNQFYGTIDEVALYSYALSSNQVVSHYLASSVPPQIVVNPTNTTVAEGAIATFHSSAFGSSALTYQWYQSTDGSTFTPMAGKTTATLTIANVPASASGRFYQVVATNPYGSATSTMASLTVIGGPPMILVDVPPQAFAYAGRTLTISASYGGSLPMTFYWQKDGQTLANSSRISGATTSTLTIQNVQPGDAGNYTVFASNSQGGPVGSGSAQALVEIVPDFNGTGLGWALNGTPAPGYINENQISLTDGAGNTVRSAWFAEPLYIGAFKANFVYQDLNGGGADGAAFVLQNDPRGTSALGGGGGGLGYSGIVPSAALQINIYANNTPGIAFNVNGATGGYTSTYPVDPANGNAMNVSLVYSGGILQVIVSDPLSGGSFTTNIAVNLPATVGADTAYVGFTAADGGTVSTQIIKNFSFTPYTLLAASPGAPGTTVLSWPASVGGYTLQSRASLTSGTWQAVTAPVTQVDGVNKVAVSNTGSLFYRLVLVP